MSSNSYYAGLDIGGTSIKTILVDQDGAPVGNYGEVDSNVKEGYHRTFEQLNLGLKEICEASNVDVADVAGVGLDVPAPSCKGVIWGLANLSEDWVGTDIRSEYEADCGKPVVMTNDANAAALGEYMMRPDIDTPLLLVAPGTGFGGGFVLPGGILYEGANGLAMELGRMPVPFLENGEFPSDSAGAAGSTEAWVSLMAIRRRLELRLADPANANHVLNQSDDPIAKKAYAVRDLATAGDEMALEIFSHQAKVLGYHLADQCAELDPGLIVIGGGLAEAAFRDWFLDAVKEAFVERAQPFYHKAPIAPFQPTTNFEWAIGGDGAAAFGAARLALQAG